MAEGGGASSSQLQWLLGGGLGAREFLQDVFGQRPLHVARGAAAAQGPERFTVETLLALSEARALVYARDLNVVNCLDGRRKVVLHEAGKAARRAELSKHLTAKAGGCTVQLFQPQRYEDWLWRVMSGLEAEFCSLWGASVYLTARGSQGLAPHHDDVEVFVLQMQGRKHWRLHAPAPSQAQALEYSPDLSELGELLMDVVLQPGDLLYLPRGTVHYAVAQDEPSVHITLSTHQNMSYYNLLDRAMPLMLDAAASTDVEMRRGLPHGFLRSNGVWRADRAAPSALVTNVARLLRRIADSLESSSVDEEESVAQALHEGVDAFAVDFISNRLPPYHAVAKKRHAKTLTVKSRLRLIDPNLLHVCIVQPGGDGEEEEEEEGEGEEAEQQPPPQQQQQQQRLEGAQEEDEYVLRVHHSLHNDRETHMGISEPSERSQVVDLDRGALAFMGRLLAAYPAFELLDKLHPGGAAEALEWARALADERIVEWEP